MTSYLTLTPEQPQAVCVIVLTLTEGEGANAEASDLYSLTLTRRGGLILLENVPDEGGKSFL